MRGERSDGLVHGTTEAVGGARGLREDERTTEERLGGGSGSLASAAAAAWGAADAIGARETATSRGAGAVSAPGRSAEASSVCFMQHGIGARPSFEPAEA